MAIPIIAEIGARGWIVGPEALHAISDGVACDRRRGLIILRIAIARRNPNPSAIRPFHVTAPVPIIIPASAPLAFRCNNGAGGRTDPSPDSCTAATACDATDDSPRRRPQVSPRRAGPEPLPPETAWLRPASTRSLIPACGAYAFSFCKCFKITIFPHHSRSNPARRLDRGYRQPISDIAVHGERNTRRLTNPMLSLGRGILSSLRKK